MMGPCVLTAEWRSLAILNYEVDPSYLLARVPAGTEIDLWDGRALVSIVAFLFLKSKLFGFRMPFHQQFAEVNLRFYVRGPAGQRGIVFIQNIVPNPAVALVAGGIFQEHFRTLPVTSAITLAGDAGGNARYEWRYRGVWSHFDLHTTGPIGAPAPESVGSFVTDRDWAYTALRDGTSQEYRIEHAPPRVWPAACASLELNDAFCVDMYGPELARSLQSRPRSALIVEGSPVKARRGQRLVERVSLPPTPVGLALSRGIGDSRISSG